MRLFFLLMAASVAMLAVPTASQARLDSKVEITKERTTPGICSKAYTVRMTVIRKHGERAPGRNICRHGVRHSNGRVVDASWDQKKRYLFQLRRLAAPPITRYVRNAAVPPRQTPAGTLSSATRYAGGGNYAIPASIVMCESGGNYNAVNPSSGAYGAYQILPSTAAAYGCDLSTPGGQDRCAAKVWAGQGRGAWVC